MSNPSSSSGNGSIYSNGYTIGQNAALKQNAMNNAIGGRGKRGTGKRGRGKRGTKTKRRGKRGTKTQRRLYKGGADVTVQPIHAPYPNNSIQSLNTNLTKVSAQQQSNSQFDGNVKTGGSRRRTNRRRTLRKSRRHM
jgi:hypothetical protein